MNDVINNLKKFDTCKIQLTLVIKFMSSKDTEEDHVKYSKSKSKVIVIHNKADEFIDKLFESLLSRCQIDLEISMKGSDFIFDYVDLLHYKCHKTIPKRGVSYIDSPI